jgi:hypothetical protein
MRGAEAYTEDARIIKRIRRNTAIDLNLNRRDDMAHAFVPIVF